MALAILLEIAIGHAARADDAETLDHLAQKQVDSGRIARFDVIADERKIFFMLSPTVSPISEAAELIRMGAFGRGFCLEATAPLTWSDIWTVRVMSPDVSTLVFSCQFPMKPEHLRQP
jgi:hypothetical protein